MKKKKQPSGVRKKSTKEKISMLEEKISELESRLPEAEGLKAGRIERQLRVCREELKVLKTHMVSKLSSVHYYVVPGSYGSKN
ncbi:hypothetical protein N7613_00910 [Pseudomonas juntendi]|uniref:hypothetical protein n=1 Tax=Pseudomonas juntendi TaxID=2666183 RepID=UPI0018E6A1FB|nr:hypothetical protein [Pseudomonas juntendi]MBI6912471.1 hypothetical protein [Pseudomonas juntendi]MDG9807190.1 hypothetical protein [Pseudomonas juntendi]